LVSASEKLIFEYSHSFLMKKHYCITFIALSLLVPSILAQNLALENSLKHHVTILASDSLGGRAFGFPEKALAIDYITGQYSSAGFKPLNKAYIRSFESKSGLTLVEGKNIIGIIEGSDPVLKDEYILLGAHYDHLGWKKVKGKKVVYNGADDNASGVASIIEAGKILLAKRNDLKRSVIIAAFDGEEAGLLGSRAFVNDSVIDLSKIKTVFSLDMVGMASKNKGVELNGIKSIKDGESLAKQVTGNRSISLRKTMNVIEMQTDTWHFGLKGIPAIHVFTGTVSPYHKPEDDSNLLDYQGMSRIVDLTCDLVSDLANRDKVEANQRFINHYINPKFSIGLMANTGRSYHYFEEAFYDSKSVWSVETGIVAQARITTGIWFQPAITWELSGSNTDAGILRMQSLNPQADLLINIKKPEPGYPSMFLIAGGFYRFNFAATESGSAFDLTTKYYKTEPGIRFGLGMQYKKLQMNFGYKYGLTKVNKVDTDGDVFTRGTYFSWTRFF
jgi:aminopeptidase YwaD